MSYYKQGWEEASHDKTVEDYEEYFSRDNQDYDDDEELEGD